VVPQAVAVPEACLVERRGSMVLPEALNLQAIEMEGLSHPRFSFEGCLLGP
jgi:hypothetical protein